MQHPRHMKIGCAVKIGDWVMEQLAVAGFEKEEDYYMFYDSDWD